MEDHPETRKISLSEIVVKTIAHNLSRYNAVLIRHYLSSESRQMVIDYINAGGGNDGTRNVNSTAVLGLLNQFTKHIDHKLLTLIEPSQEMTSEEIAQLIDTLMQCITDANAPIQHLDLYYDYFGCLVTIMPSSLENICRMQSLSFLSVGDLQILLTQFVQITVEIATLNFIEARRVEVNDDVGVLVSTCGRFVYQEICYDGTVDRENLFHIKMKTDASGSVPPNQLPFQCLRIVYLNDIAQLEMLGKLSQLTRLAVHVPWNFDAEQLTDDRLPSWPRLTSLGITCRERTADCKQYFMILLCEYGRNVDSLDISDFGPELNLTLTLPLCLCPNLKSMNIKNCHLD